MLVGKFWNFFRNCFQKQYTLTVDATADFKWKAFFTDSAFAPAQYAYELSL